MFIDEMQLLVNKKSLGKKKTSEKKTQNTEVDRIAIAETGTE